MSKAIDTVNDFFAAIGANDKARIMAFFTEQSVYHNIPLEPRTGLEAIWQELAQVLAVSSEVDWVVHDIAVSERGNVLTERTDRFLINGCWAEFKVMGIFEVKDGKITRWRDYFDLQQTLSQLS